MEKAVGIDILGLGIMSGRDCIHTDSVTADNTDDLVFRGEINGALAGKSEDIWIPYTLVFHHIIAYFCCETDTYLNTGHMHTGCTAFNTIENSSFLRDLPIREDFDRSVYKHYQIFTYDNVYDIIAASFDIDLHN